MVHNGQKACSTLELDWMGTVQKIEISYPCHESNAHCAVCSPLLYWIILSHSF
jgi:Zn-finger protein